MQEIPPGFQIDLPITSDTPQAMEGATIGDQAKSKQWVSQDQNKPILEDFNPNPRWTFDNFVKDETNAMAARACQRLVKGPHDQLLLLLADVGQGKSHLLHACARAWKERHPESRCRLISAATFTHDFVQSLLDKKTGLGFHKEIRDLDALFFDDLHFVTSKRATCQALFQGIEALRNRSVPVIITCRAPFNELVGLEPWMKSRLQEGLVNIQHANTNLRRRLVEQLSASRYIQLSDEIVNLLINELPGSPRELSGAVTRIAEYQELNQDNTIGIERVRLLLMDFFSGRSSVPNVDAIKSRVASYFGVNIEDLSAASRQRRLTRPRQIAMFFCKKLTSRSLPEIGRLFGNRDHSTVIHAVQVVEKRRQDDPIFEEELLSLERQIRECPV